MEVSWWCFDFGEDVGLTRVSAGLEDAVDAFSTDVEVVIEDVAGQRTCLCVCARDGAFEGGIQDGLVADTDWLESFGVQCLVLGCICSRSD